MHRLITEETSLSLSLSTKPVPAIHVENLTLSSGVDFGWMVHTVEGSGSMGQLSLELWKVLVGCVEWVNIVPYSEGF